MTLYRYQGGGAFLQGLPTQDLDSDALSPEQLELLELALAMRLYAPVEPGVQETPADILNGLLPPTRRAPRQARAAPEADLRKGPTDEQAADDSG